MLPVGRFSARSIKTMELLSDKYISGDELLNIAYNTKTKHIFSFCQLNKLSNDICRNVNFWLNYIDNDQQKYNSIILEFARNGRFKLFKELWGINLLKYKNIDIISEPASLIPAFELAYLNGYEEFSKYLIKLDILWREYQRKIRLSDGIKSNFSLTSLSININKLYESWANDTGKNKIIDASWYKNTSIILLRQYLIRDDVDDAINLLTEVDIHYYAYNLSYCNSLFSLKKILKAISRPENDDDIIWLNIINGAIVNNMSLAKEILHKNPKLKKYIYDYNIKASKSPNIIDFIHEYLDIDSVAANSIGSNYENKILVNYILDTYSDDSIVVHNIILKSERAFKPYEYVNLLIDYMGCITSKEKKDIIIDMLNAGQYYKIKVLLENISVCYE